MQYVYVGFSLYIEKDGQDYGDYKTYVSGNENVWTSGNTLNIELPTAYTDPGRYYMDITAYTLYMSDGTTPSTPQRIYFTVDPDAENTSVETIGSEERGDRIFTIMGVEVEDMSEPGIYVCNGKKFIIR